MKPAAALTAALVLVSLAACQQPSVGEAQATFCASLDKLSATVESFKKLPSNPTVQQVQTAGTAVRDAWGEVTSAAQQLKTARMDALQASYDELSASVEVAKDDSTLTQQLTNIQAAIAKFDATAKVLTATVCRTTTQ